MTQLEKDGYYEKLDINEINKSLIVGLLNNGAIYLKFDR